MIGHKCIHVAVVISALMAVCHVGCGAENRSRVVGLWHVDGAFADWRFAEDGTFIEEGIWTTKGSYELLDENRIRISPGIGLSCIYTLKVDKPDLLLIGPAISFRLTPKK
jgi:hypothetical protein